MTLLAHFIWLVVLWLALWGEISVANVAGGVLVAAAVIGVFHTHRSGELVVRPVRVAHFTVYFLYKLVESSIVVIREIVTRENRLRRGIVAVPLTGCSDAVVTIIANSISLTPGTLTLEVRREPLTLFVHVLHLNDVDEVRRDIHELEVLAIRAFGTRDALEALQAAAPPPEQEARP